MSTAASPTKYQYVSDRYGPDPFTCTQDEFLAMVAELVRDNPTDWTMPHLREAPDGSLRELVNGMWETVLVPMTITLDQLTTLSDPAEINRALRDDLAGRDPQAIATTEINGGDTATIVDDQGAPQTIAQVLTEINAFLDAQR